MLRPAQELERLLGAIDGRGYRAYRDIAGGWAVGDVALWIDHVQGDPFAAPSRLRARLPMEVAALPAELRDAPVRRIALADRLARELRRATRGKVDGRGSGRSGRIFVDAGGQEILERTAVVVTAEWVEARLEVGLPAAGRRILGGEARRLLLDQVPRAARQALRWDAIDQHLARRWVAAAENHRFVQDGLADRGLVAFVAEGAVLPRESGASQRPLRGDAVVPFVPPESLTLELELPADRDDGSRVVRGMGLPAGVTLVVGGGYHGKSTLLQALQRGVYPHVPGDGRELVVTRRDALKVRAEDGRRAERVDIQSFIRELPGGRSTARFSTEDASGSTSQAASIVEALESGCGLLLLDEDTSATNFLVRDARMQALVAREHEPITPFVDRVRALHREHGTSSVLVMGGSGDYLDVADVVLMLRDYRPLDVTERARTVARERPSGRRAEAAEPMAAPAPRVPLAESFDHSRGRRDVKIDVKGTHLVVFGTTALELAALEQLVDTSQTRAAAFALHLASRRLMDGVRTLSEVLDALEEVLGQEGLDILDPRHRPGRHPGNLARPRRQELAAAMNRLRTVRMRDRP
jgi:predicted ABC-class ATPase